MRRTPKLTATCRSRFEEILLSDGWTPGYTIPLIARETGLSADQVRDAIFAESADEWRQELIRRINAVVR